MVVFAILEPDLRPLLGIEIFSFIKFNTQSCNFLVSNLPGITMS